MTLVSADRTLLGEARRATLATIDPAGRPRLVPICFVLIGDVIWSPLDEKPKASSDPRRLARVRDIEVRPSVALLVDHWSEEWSELAWLRIRGSATIVEPRDVPSEVVAALRAKYPQYADHDLEHRPMIAITIERVTSWSAAERS